MPLRQQNGRLVRYERDCMFCGNPACVLLPEGADDLDVEAEFSSLGRAFGDDDECVGVGCYRCSRERWSSRTRHMRDAGYRA